MDEKEILEIMRAIKDMLGIFNKLNVTSLLLKVWGNLYAHSDFFYRKVYQDHNFKKILNITLVSVGITGIC